MYCFDMRHFPKSLGRVRNTISDLLLLLLLNEIYEVTENSLKTGYWT